MSLLGIGHSFIMGDTNKMGTKPRIKDILRKTTLVFKKVAQFAGQKTDGFLVTVAEPYETGLSVYVIFNCYGCGPNPGRFPEAKRYRKMILEIALIDEAVTTRCKRFNWDKMIPIEVSNAPSIQLRGKKLRKATSMLTEQEWGDVYSFIVRHRSAIEKHWLGFSCSIELLREVGVG